MLRGYEDIVPDESLSRPAETLPIRESVRATEPADRTVFIFEERQGRVRVKGVSERFEFTIGCPLPDRRIECQRIEKDIDILNVADILLD